MEEKLKHSGYMYMEEKPHLKISEMILEEPKLFVK